MLLAILGEARVIRFGRVLCQSIKGQNRKIRQVPLIALAGFHHSVQDGIHIARMNAAKLHRDGGNVALGPIDLLQPPFFRLIPELINQKHGKQDKAGGKI